MTTLTPTLATTPRRAPLLPLLGQLVLAELRRMVRNPMFAMGTLGFPLIFFALFGLPNVHQKTAGGVDAGQYILVSFGTYSLLSLAMFSFGAAVAAERTGGWLRLMRAAPLPAPLYLGAKILAALCFSAVSLTALYLFAHFAGGVTFAAGQGLSIAAQLLVGMIPLIALGLCIGFLASPASASVGAQIISVLLSFGSGLFIPLEGLPKVVRDLGPYLTSYHLGGLGWNAVAGQQSGEHWVWLLGYTLVLGLLAAWAYRRDEARGQ